MEFPSVGASDAALIDGLEGVVQDGAMLRIANHLLRWSVEIEAGRMRDVGAVEILRLAAKCIIDATEGGA